MVAILLMATVTAIPASAANYTNSTTVSSSSRFKSEWEKTRTYKVGSTVIAYMVYGYDTDYINEDYVWTKATGCYSTAMVKRNYYDTGYQAGTQKGKNVYSKIEVKHVTYNVSYKIKLSTTYSNVTYTTASSSVK